MIRIHHLRNTTAGYESFYEDGLNFFFEHLDAQFSAVIIRDLFIDWHTNEP